MSDTARELDDIVATLPVQLHVDGRRCVVVGGGAVATRRTRALLVAGARVTVIAPVLDPALDALAVSNELQVRRREFHHADLEPAGADREPAGAERVMLVVTATDDARVNESAAVAAAALGILVNRADDAAKGDVGFPATLRRGPATIAVSTGTPVASRWVAERLDDALDQVLGLDATGLESLVGVLSEVRSELRRGGGATTASAGADERGVTVDAVDWRSALDGSILELIHQGRRAEAKERLLACLSSS